MNMALSPSDFLLHTTKCSASWHVFYFVDENSRFPAKPISNVNKTGREPDNRLTAFPGVGIARNGLICSISCAINKGINSFLEASFAMIPFLAPEMTNLANDKMSKFVHLYVC